MTVLLHGYKFSVYTRIAKMTLVECGVDFTSVEINPFDANTAEALAKLHPFARVPILELDGFEIFETSAITRYLAQIYPDAGLVPPKAKAAGRMQQVMSIVDNYVYWPLVRQVFSHAVFRPAFGENSDQSEIAAGLERARDVLVAFEEICVDGLVLNTRGTTLADMHLAPMIGYFAQAPEGNTMLVEFPALSDWFNWVKKRASYKQSEPVFPHPLS